MNAPIITTEWFGGQAPVQGVGTVQVLGAFVPARHWYFRARGDEWSVDVGGLDPGYGGLVAEEDTDLTVSGDYGQMFDASYMLEEHARQAITAALERWGAGERGEVSHQLGVEP